MKERIDPVLKYFLNNIFHPRIIKFTLVGGIGVIVNMGVLYLLTTYFNVYYVISSLIAIEVSIISNFVLNNFWTWKDRNKKNFMTLFLKYHISVALAAFLINWPLLIFLTEVFDVFYLLSNLIGIGIGMIFNFIINDLWTFKHQD